MMRRPGKDEVAYYRGDGFQAAILPYADGIFGMVLFLPDAPAGLDDFLQNLTAENWARWMHGFIPTPGEIILPRFKLESKFSLGSLLSAHGMEIAFSRQADFSGICDMRVWIDQIEHRTFLKVNEQGSEAAAATAAAMRVLGFTEVPEEFSMVFDHPFFCAIMDKRTGSILFAAAVVDPEQ
jgi:serine protease inhibitor